MGMMMSKKIREEWRNFGMKILRDLHSKLHENDRERGGEVKKS
jgi:hypothetical protein